MQSTPVIKGMAAIKVESWVGVHITVKELFPIIVSVAICGRQWRGRRVRCHCNNAALVANINLGTTNPCN